MRVSGLTAGGDWTFGRGKSNYLQKSAAVRQNLLTRLRSFKNDYFADIDAGGDWFAIFGTRGNDLAVKREVERITLQTTGIRAITSLNVTKQDRTRTVTIELSYVDLYDQTYVEQVQIL